MKQWSPRGSLAAMILAALGCAGDGDGMGATRIDDLIGTAWQVEAIDGQAVTAGVVSTLVFPARGQLAGRAGCNRFTGGLVVEEDRITAPGPFAMTRMMCPPPAMEQEQRFMRALVRARRLARDGETLRLVDEAGAAVIEARSIAPDEA